MLGMADGKRRRGRPTARWKDAEKEMTQLVAGTIRGRAR